MNSLALVNDSNVDWNEGLPDGLSHVKLDWLSLSDLALVVPEAHRNPGRWVVVAAVTILENHNCGWLPRNPNPSSALPSIFGRLPSNDIRKRFQPR
jgi:hypothetical protein